jgi:HK97 family phage major capsid protein
MDLSILDNDKARLCFVKECKTSALDTIKASWHELHETRKSTGAALDVLLDRASSRELNESEQNAYDFGIAQLGGINNEFDRRETHGTKDPISVPVIGGYIAGGSVKRQMDENRTLQPGMAKFRDVFGNTSDRDFTGTNINEFFGILGRGVHDSRMERRSAVEGIGALGGFSVPTQTAEKIYDISLESEIVRPRSLVLPVQYGSSLNIPLWNNESHASGLAGMQGVWMAEEGTATPQDPALKLIRLDLHKLALYADVSNELIADGINFASQLTLQMSKALAFNFDECFLTGNGVGRPEGVQTSSACISVSRAVASQIAYNDVVDIFARLYPGCWQNAVWVAHPSTIPQLANIKDGASHNLWVQSAQEGMPGSLLGRPIFFSEKVDSLGSKGDIGLYDFSQYCIIMRQEIAIQKNEGPGWYQDLTSFRAIVRINGKSLWPTPVTPRNGTDTLSPFVILQ